METENGIVQFLNQGWVALVVSGAFGALSIWLPQRLNSKPCLRYSRDVFKIFSKSLGSFGSKIKILYEEKEIEALYCTRLYFWNSGRSTLRGADIARNDRLHLEYDKSKATLVDIRLRSLTRVVTTPSIEIYSGANDVAISFEFLDHKDGFCIDCLFSGEEVPVVVSGTIIGSKRGCCFTMNDQLAYESMRITMRQVESMIPYLPYMFMFVSVVAVGLGIAIKYLNVFGGLGIGSTGLFAVSVCTFFYAALLWGIARRRYPRELDSDIFAVLDSDKKDTLPT